MQKFNPMKKLSLILGICLMLISCSSKNNESNKIPSTEPVQNKATSSTSAEENESAPAKQSVNTTPNHPSDNLGYDNGYKFGYDMGFIAAQNNDEYNPYLPVGPNVCNYSQEYRRAYAMGYSDGYTKGEQSSQVIYSDDEDEVYYEFEEDDEYYYEYDE